MAQPVAGLQSPKSPLLISIQALIGTNGAGANTSTSPDNSSNVSNDENAEPQETIGTENFSVI